MRQKIVKKSIALLSICLMMLVQTMPVLAAESNTRYRISEFLFSVPETNGYTGKLTGPDVSEDGTVFMELGKKYNFTWEGTAPGRREDYGFDFYFGIRDFDTNFGGETFRGLSIDGEKLFAEYPQNGYEVKIQFIDVSLQELRENDAQVLTMFFDGLIKIEVRCMVEEVYEVEPPKTEQEFETYHQTLRENHVAQRLQQPQELVYYMEYDGTNWSSWYDDQSKVLTMHCVFNVYQSGKFSNEIYNCVAEYMGERYEFPKETTGDSLVVMRPYIGLGILPLVWEWEPFVPKTNNTMGEKAIATAATAGAIGLGGSALVGAVPNFSEEDDLPVQKKHIYGKDEESEQMQNLEEMPELPKEDTPNVSMSIYKPFKALVNTKGAAADLNITIKGGEGLHWNFLPTAVCLDGLKAVVPTVLGHREEATLVLAMTGAVMKKAHTSIFVTIIAWAYTETGQLVKTTGSTEITLHQKGLEAKWLKDGKLQVTSYSDGNLDGIAEVTELTEDEYIITEIEDGAILITAKDAKYGTTKISGKPKCRTEE